MSKKAYMFTAMLLGLLVISAVAAHLYLKHQARLEQRHHLLCEVLKPGMSKEEVLSVLRQAGDFTMSQAEWQGGLIELDINFIDPKISDRYGCFSILFINYKYERAYVKYGSDNFEGICNFYKPTQSIDETPKSAP